MNDVVSVMHKRDLDFTLLGIGPMSEIVLEVTFELARDKDFPVILIASRNQVDALRFGGGYVRGWDQTQFVGAIRRTAQEAAFEGLLYVCRDHGGPWQRDNERRERLPANRAMQDARDSFIEDVKAGFDLLHVDPTRHADGDPSVPFDTVAARTVDLVGAVEDFSRSAGRQVSYEIGTEEIAGGLTQFDAFEDYLRRTTENFARKGFARPAFIVGQTGTLVKMRSNVGRFEQDVARRLAGIAKAHGVGFKEHNADYLDDEILRVHPACGITAANVAPEFGVAETCAYLELAETERAEAAAGRIGSASDFAATLRRAVFDSARWRKWLVEPWSDDDVMSDPGKLDEISRVAGHYCFDDPHVARQRKRMFANLASCGIEAVKLVKTRVRDSIDRYVRHFNLEGSTTKLRDAAAR